MPRDSSNDRDAALRTTRRTVIGQAALLAGGAMVGGPARAIAARRTAPATGAIPPRLRHGGQMAQRGVEIAVHHGRLQEARFGLLFKRLPAFEPPDDLLVALAGSMSEPQGQQPGAGPYENAEVPAGFTFLGQFIVHDMTLDRTPLTQQQQDPDAMHDFDTPFLDLGAIYGRGPRDDPQLYEADGRLRLIRTGGVDDIPRKADGTGILGDARNDENLVLAQLHIAFMKFHNRLVAEGHPFVTAQQLSRWHFQWLTVHDFLGRIVGDDVVARFLTQHGNGPIQVDYEYYKPKNPNRPMMPIEFSVAAYRFGHSTVSATYTIRPGTVAALFADPSSGNDLSGSRPIPARLEIDWRTFFQLPGAPAPANTSRLIDTKLTPPLHQLPPTVVPDIPPFINDLAQRNLIRGKRVGLPSGQDVARAMGATARSNAELGLTDPGWDGKAPLWYYVLKEAELTRQGRRLGDVGGRIVAETILGVIDKDRGSYFHARWRPAPPIAPADGKFGIGDLLAYARA